MMTEAEFRAAIAAEQKADRAGGRAFAEACAAGDVDRLLTAVDILNETTVDGWRHAMRGVAKLASITPEIRMAFLPVWIESKMLPNRVGARRVLADALRVLLPGGQTESTRLYRGAGGAERRRRLYGFSWTTEIKVARGFAEHWIESMSGGVLLETYAPPEAILLVREKESYYDEAEVVVDPFKLGKITVLERLA